MNGVEAASEIRKLERYKSTPLVMLTSIGRREVSGAFAGLSPNRLKRRGYSKHYPTFSAVRRAAVLLPTSVRKKFWPSSTR
jgi:hypothetical protein